MCVLLSLPAGVTAQGVVHQGALATAPRPETRRWLGTVSAVELARGALNAEGERAVARWLSVAFGGRLTFQSGGVTVTSTTVGVGLDVGVRVYLGGEAPRGLFLGLQGAVTAALGVGGDDRASSTGVGLGLTVGALAGYTLVFENRFVLSVGGGAGYTRSDPSYAVFPVPGYAGVVPLLRLSLGYAW